MRVQPSNSLKLNSYNYRKYQSSFSFYSAQPNQSYTNSKKTLFYNLNYIKTKKYTCRVCLEKWKWITTSTFTIYLSINFSLNIWRDWWDVLITSYFIITFQNEQSYCEVKAEARKRNGNYGRTLIDNRKLARQKTSFPGFSPASLSQSSLASQERVEEETGNDVDT